MDEKLVRINQILEELVGRIPGLSLQQEAVQNGANRGGQVGRMARVEFPRFNGDDVRDWIFRCEQFFLLDNIPEDQKVRLIYVQPYDKAMMWHRQFIKL